MAGRLERKRNPGKPGGTKCHTPGNSSLIMLYWCRFYLFLYKAALCRKNFFTKYRCLIPEVLARGTCKKKIFLMPTQSSVLQIYRRLIPEVLAHGTCTKKIFLMPTQSSVPSLKSGVVEFCISHRAKILLIVY